DVDQLPVRARPFQDGPPGAIDARPVLLLRQPTAADPTLHGAADHAGAGEFVVALGMVDHLVPAPGPGVLVRPERGHALPELAEDAVPRGVIFGPVAQGRRQAERREAVAAAPGGLAERRVAVEVVGAEAELAHRGEMPAGGVEVLP